MDGAERGWTLKRDQILFIKALENYIDVHFLDRDRLIAHRLIRSTMKKVELALKPQGGFFRCHRSFIVNVARAGRIRPGKGSCSLTIADSHESIPVSRGSKCKLKELLSGR